MNSRIFSVIWKPRQEIKYVPACSSQRHRHHTEILYNQEPERSPLSCSVLGRLLWNVLHDDVVSQKILNCNVIAYADDLAVVVYGSDTEVLLLSVELAKGTIETVLCCPSSGAHDYTDEQH